MTYQASDHDAIRSSVFEGDKVELKLKKAELDRLEDSTRKNITHEVYGLSKNGRNYIDIDIRTELMDKDAKYVYFFLVLGLIMLPYGFIKGKPSIEMDKAAAIWAVLAILIMLLFI
jgi:hypothetical protein